MRLAFVIGVFIGLFVVLVLVVVSLVLLVLTGKIINKLVLIVCNILFKEITQCIIIENDNSYVYTLID